MAISKAKLKKLDGTWKKTRDEYGDATGGFETIPSAKYVVGNLKAELDEDQNGCVRVLRESTVQEGEHEGFVLKERMNIDPSISPRGQEFLLKWLNFLGYQVDSLAADLEETLEAISDNTEATFQVQVVEKDGFNNVFFNKILEEGNLGGEGDENPDENPDEESDKSSVDRGEMPDIDDMSMRKLKKVIKDNDLDVGDLSGMDEDDVRDEIETAWDKPSKNDNDAPSKKPAASAKKAAKKVSKKAAKKKADPEVERTALYELGDSFGIPVSEKDSLATLKKTFSEYTFTDDELNDDEMAILNRNGLSDTITTK